MFFRNWKPSVPLGSEKVARSTFADANTSRQVGFFQDLFGEMYALCKPIAPHHKFRFKSKLFSMDSDARTHESRVARALELPKGSIVTFDKGYINYSWFRLLAEKGMYFVTRLKQNAVYKLLERRPVNRKKAPPQTTSLRSSARATPFVCAVSATVIR